MKILENVTGYQCEFCGKKSFKRLVHHEQHCKKNPNNKHKCFDFCKHLNKERNEDGRITFTCLKTDQKMYSYIAERRGFIKNKFIVNADRMPLECDLHQYLGTYLGLPDVPDTELNNIPW